jgi:hypothetical protein
MRVLRLPYIGLSTASEQSLAAFAKNIFPQRKEQNKRCEWSSEVPKLGIDPSIAVLSLIHFRIGNRAKANRPTRQTAAARKAHAWKLRLEPKVWSQPNATADRPIIDF